MSPTFLGISLYLVGVEVCWGPAIADFNRDCIFRWLGYLQEIRDQLPA